jgi:hypothetical protein
MRKFLILCIAATLHTLQAQTIDKTPPIEPPFGMTWGENEENLSAWIEKNNYTSREEKGPDNRVAREILGPFPNAEFHKIKVYFSKNRLTEIELQFNNQSPEATKEPELESFTKALSIKNKIDEQYGTGKLIRNERGERDNTKWHYIHQIWSDEEHAIWLTIFNASKPDAGSMSVASLHFRWEKAIAESKLEKKSK